MPKPQFGLGAASSLCALCVTGLPVLAGEPLRGSIHPDISAATAPTTTAQGRPLGWHDAQPWLHATADRNTSPFDDAGDNDSPEANDNDQEVIDTTDIFGFVEGSDTSPAGTRTLSQDAIVRWSRAGRGFVGLRGSLSATYSVTDRLSLSLGPVASHEQTSLRAGAALPAEPLDAGVGATGFGLTASAKYRLLQRGTRMPGVALEVTPFWERENDTDRLAATSVGAEIRLLADAALISERLFAAVNAAYTSAADSSGANGSWVGTSELELSGAVAARVAPRLFLGGELRHLSAHDGALLDDWAGWALFAGPTLYVELGEAGYAGAAWSVQVAGRSAAEPGRRLDLANYERHQLRVKSGFVF